MDAGVEAEARGETGEDCGEEEDVDERDDVQRTEGGGG